LRATRVLLLISLPLLHSLVFFRFPSRLLPLTHPSLPLAPTLPSLSPLLLCRLLLTRVYFWGVFLQRTAPGVLFAPWSLYRKHTLRSKLHLSYLGISDILVYRDVLLQAQYLAEVLACVHVDLCAHVHLHSVHSVFSCKCMDVFTRLEQKL